MTKTPPPIPNMPNTAPVTAPIARNPRNERDKGKSSLRGTCRGARQVERVRGLGLRADGFPDILLHERDRLPVIGGPENPGPGDDHVRPRGGDRADVVGLDPAVDLDVDVEVRAGELG